MYCGKCGTENDNSAKFCKNCGQPLKAAAAPKAVRSAEKAEPSEKKAPAAAGISVPVKKESSGKGSFREKKLPIPLLAGAAVLVIAGSLYLTRTPSIDLNDYTTIRVSGYNGYGRAEASVDWNAIEEEYGGKLKLKGDALKQYNGFGSSGALFELEYSVSYELSPDDDLENGQEITWTWDVSDSLEKSLNYKIVHKDFTYKVQDLEELETFDAFEGLELEFMGSAPFGYVNLNYLGSDLSITDFSCDDSWDLKNGDTVTVTISDDCVQRCASSLGRVPESRSRDYTVTGLLSYVTKGSELDEETLQAMNQQASDSFLTETADWSDEVSLQDFTYIGNYLLTPKNMDRSNAGNMLFMVYKYQSHGYYANNDRTQVYDDVMDGFWYLNYTDVMIDEAGKIQVNLLDYETSYEIFLEDTGVEGFFGTHFWTYPGYDTLDDLYSDTVLPFIESYNHEDNVDESLAPAIAKGASGKSAAAEETTTAVETSTAAETAAASVSDASEYKLPNSDTRNISARDLNGFTAEDCRIARNELYARHGCIFEDPALQAYFDSCSWYTAGTVKAKEYPDSGFSETEIDNRKVIQAYEAAHNYNQ